jgi:hypothetical protein
MAQVNKFEPVEVKTIDGWFVKLIPEPWSNMVSLYIGQSTPNKNFICNIDEYGELIEHEVKSGKVDIKPTMKISRLIWDSLSMALQGVAQPPEKSHIEGELQATKYHLEDMRKLALKEIK